MDAPELIQQFCRNNKNDIDAFTALAFKQHPELEHIGFGELSGSEAVKFLSSTFGSPVKTYIAGVLMRSHIATKRDRGQELTDTDNMLHEIGVHFTRISSYAIIHSGPEGEAALQKIDVIITQAFGELAQRTGNSFRATSLENGKIVRRIERDAPGSNNRF